MNYSRQLVKLIQIYVFSFRYQETLKNGRKLEMALEALGTFRGVVARLMANTSSLKLHLKQEAISIITSNRIALY